MYEEDFQGVDLHGRIHIPEVDWMSSTSRPNQNQEEGILFSTYTKKKIGDINKFSNAEN